MAGGSRQQICRTACERKIPDSMNDIFRDVFLGFVRVHLLHHASRGPIFGVEMIGELRHHGYDMSPGTLYPILHALERAGYLASEQAVVAGKARKYYRATPAGGKALLKLQARIRELVDEVLEPAPDRKPAPARRRSVSAA